MSNEPENKYVAQGAVAWQEKEIHERIMYELSEVYGCPDSYFLINGYYRYWSLKVLPFKRAVEIAERGNHEEMMLQCCHTKVSAFEFLRWNRNGNAATLSALRRLDVEEQKAILEYLRSLPRHLRIQVDGIPYYLVHGFPSDNPDEELWKRPELNEPNPIAGTRVIIGHTPVLNLVVPRNELNRFIKIMDKRNEHPQILFARGYIDIDCGCSYGEPFKTLGCLRLEDLAEFYEVSKTYPMQRMVKNAV